MYYPPLPFIYTAIGIYLNARCSFLFTAYDCWQWCNAPDVHHHPPGVFTWQHFWGNSASTKGKLLIRHETIASAAGIAISDGTKHWLLLYSHPPLPFHPYQKSPLNHSIHTAHPLSPSNTASSVKHDLPFIAARATEREGTATGGRERWRGREKKKKKERERSKRPRPPFISAAWLCSFALLPRFWQTLPLPLERPI